MSIEVKSIFISSTSDLVEEREATWEVIRQYQMEREVLPYISDYDLRPGETPESRILDEIKKADLFLMILGGRYGTPYPEAKKQPPPSICEWEFSIAKKRHLKMFSLEKAIPNEAVEEPQRHFRDRVREFRRGSWRRSFSNKDEFTRAFSAALMAWRGADSKVGRTLYLATIFVLVAACIVQLFAFPWVDDHVSRRYALALYMMTSSVFTGFSINLLIRILHK